MRLLAPVASLEGARKALDAGADDIYFGAASPYMGSYSFNGRGAHNHSGKNVLIHFEYIKDLVDFAHDRGARVTYLANIPLLNDGPEGNEKIIVEQFNEYILAGVEAGVDFIVVGDLGAIQLVKELKVSVPIVASSYLEAQNIKAIEFLEGLGVSKVILSYQVKLGEIIDIAKKTVMPLEVFGHGGCSFYVGSCNLFHEAGEGSNTNFNVGYPCRGTYIISSEGMRIKRGRFLDSFKMCSICSLKELTMAGIDTLKVVGRDLDSDFIVNVIKVYRRAMDLAIENLDIRKHYREVVPLWWHKMWCSSGQRCRYIGGEQQFDSCH